MSIKRTKITDGIFTSEILEVDMTSREEIDLFQAALTASGVGARIERLEAFVEQCMDPSPPVALRLGALRETLAQAKRAHGEAKEALVTVAEMWRREIKAFPLARKGIRFSQGRAKDAFGPLRKLVRKMLACKGNQALTARQLWAACKALPERQRAGIDFSSDADAWIPDHGPVSFRRFANIVSEERKLLR